MSQNFSANNGAFRKHHLHQSGPGLPYKGHDQGPRYQTPESLIQSEMRATPQSAVLAHGLPTPAVEMATDEWQTQNFGPALNAPVTHTPAGRYAARAQASEQFEQIPVSHSRSPNGHARTPSHADTLSRQNKELRDELEELRASRDEMEEARDNMLTDLMTTQEALVERDAEVQSLREQLSRQEAKAQSGLSRDDDRELRDLRLRCNRLQGELRQKDEQLRQAQTQTNMHHAMYGNTNLNMPDHMQDNRELLDTRQRYMDAKKRANRAEHMHQQAQQQADSYAQQLRDWSAAYDGIKASYDGLKTSYDGLKASNDEMQRAQSETMHTTRSHAEQEAAQQQQQLAKSKAAVEDMKKMRDFYRSNSESVAKKNTEITDLVRRLQDELQAKTSESEQQRLMLRQLQVQVR